MKPLLDETHDPRVQSWVDSANDAASDFPIQNLPFGTFRRRATAKATVGIAIGDQILDIAGVGKDGLLPGVDAQSAVRACESDAQENVSLNGLMALGTGTRRALRRSLFALLRAQASATIRETVSRHLVPQSEAEMLLPAVVGDYTDFYASISHATNVGKLFRPDNPLLPNYKYVPIGYHGRASSLVPGGVSVRRPSGQTRDGEREPVFGPSKALDYELEVGFFVSEGNEREKTIPISEAEDHIFGICLVNDWSARDIQSWEYQPLGPFLSKSFATSVSPWVVTMEALAPFRTAAFARPAGDPAPLPYLLDAEDQQYGGVSLNLEVSIRSARMRERALPPLVLGRSNLRDLYWTMAQMLTHHASNGCNLRPGDLVASGTVSGAEKSARGCLLELTSRGREPIALPDGELRRFLEDGDEIVLRGHCQGDGFRRIGLGACTGRIAAAGER